MSLSLVFSHNLLALTTILVGRGVGVLPVVDYTEWFCQKGIPLSSTRYIKSSAFTFLSVQENRKNFHLGHFKIP